MRLFFALWPPLAVAEALAAWARRLQRETGGRVVAAKNIHLTLAFLGEVPDERLPALRRLPVWGEPHALPMDEAGYWARNSLLWAGPREKPPELARIAARLHDMLATAGFPTESRPFAAHVTLIRKARAPAEMPALPALQWPVADCVLVRSALSAQGPRYEPLQRYPFA